MSPLRKKNPIEEDKKVNGEDKVNETKPTNTPLEVNADTAKVTDESPTKVNLIKELKPIALKGSVTERTKYSSVQPHMRMGRNADLNSEHYTSHNQEVGGVIKSKSSLRLSEMPLPLIRDGSQSQIESFSIVYVDRTKPL